jgi:predicted dehydrogenase
MHIGIVGLGSIGERHVSNLRKLYPHATIEILTKRKAWDKTNASITLIASPIKFYKTKHDIYFITNETYKHIPAILKCLAQKPKGIFIEKPLSHNLTGLKKIQTIAGRQSTTLFVGYNFQFFKPILKLKELIAKETIGKILFMRVSVGQDLRTWRKGNYLMGYSTDSKKGGGAVLDLIHDLNYPSFLLEEKLSFIAGYAATSALPISAEDMAESILRSPSGVIVSVHQDYLRSPGQRYCEVVGSKGTLTWVWPLKETSEIHINDFLKKRILHMHEDPNRMYIDELKWFMKMVKEGIGYTNIDEAIRDITNAEHIKKHL